MKKITLFLGLLALNLAPSASAGDDMTTLLDAARRASGFSALEAGRCLVLEGSADFLGLPAHAMILYEADGRFRRTIAGELDLETVFDGDVVWRKDYSAGPYELELSGRESELLRAWVHSGYWLSPSAPIDVEAVDESDRVEGRHVFSVRLRDGKLKAHVELDAKSLLPASLRIPNGSGELTNEFGDYRETGGVRVAHSVRNQLMAGNDLVLTVTNGQRSDSFDRPSPRSDFFLDPDRDPSVEAKLLRKRLYIRVKVDGEDAGFFVFDSGAGFSGISERAADRLDLPRLGETTYSGLGGRQTASIRRRAKTVEIGPLRIDNLVFTQIPDRSPVDNPLGHEINGVIGWDLLSRVIVDIEQVNAKMSLYPFEGYERPDAEWLPVVLHYEVPWVMARFTGDREGLFMVDTGSNNAVYVFAGATRRLGLLDGVEINPTTGVGAGGEYSRTIAPMDWFEVAGEGWRDSPTVFGLGDDGEDDPYTVGLLGGGLLRLYRLIFDYSRKRVTFLPL
jgi:hypothetical protein